MRKKILIFSLLVVLIDQLVKWLVVSKMTITTGIVIIKDFLSFTYVQNEGAAWNIFSGSRWFLICVSILAIFAVVKYFLLDAKITKMEFVGYSLMLGGIIGNLIDRLFRGYVVDFISTNFFDYDFPVFNIADSCIVVGAILVIIHLLRSTKKGRE